MVSFSFPFFELLDWLHEYSGYSVLICSGQWRMRWQANDHKDKASMCQIMGQFSVIKWSLYSWWKCSVSALSNRGPLDTCGYWVLKWDYCNLGTEFEINFHLNSHIWGLVATVLDKLNPSSCIYYGFLDYYRNEITSCLSGAMSLISLNLHLWIGGNEV